MPHRVCPRISVQHEQRGVLRAYPDDDTAKAGVNQLGADAGEKIRKIGHDCCNTQQCAALLAYGRFRR
jgi:hypothetical protein